MSFPAYPEYKDSGIEWVGKIPAHWNTVRTKNLFELMKRSPRECDGIITAFRDGQVTLRSKRREDGFTNSSKEIGYQGIRKGDLVIHAMDAFAGAIGVSDADGKSTPVYSVCRPKEGISNPHYYGPLLRNMALAGFINSLSKGIRERSTEFRWAEAGCVYLPQPPLEEQTAIAAFLDRETGKIDALIAEQEKLLTLLAEKRQATISHAVTRGINPNAPMKDSGIAWLGEVPENWEISKIKYIVREGTSVSYGIVQPGEALEQGVPFIQTSNMSNASFDLENLQKTTDQIASAYPRSKLVGGEVILGIRASIGSAYVVPEHLSGANLSRGIARIECGSKISSYYLVYALRSIPTSNYWNLSKQGSTFNEVSIETVRELSFALPSRKEQNDISNFIEKATSKLEIMKINAIKSIDILKERRSALIAAAVTGKIDVRNAVPKGEAA
jgi:type I restriction enzyme S subunit